MQIEASGREIFAATGGQDFDKAQPTIVFLHGAGMDHTVWAQTIGRDGRCSPTNGASTTT